MKKILYATLFLAFVSTYSYAGRNGSGTYTAPSNSWNPVISGTAIDSSDFNDLLDDLETGITNSIAKDGQTTITADLPMSSFKHTGVGDATARTNYLTLKQLQDGDVLELSSVSGANTLTATAPFSLTSYAQGQVFRFVATGTNTGAVTLNLNSIGAVAVQKLGAALVSGDITTGDAVAVYYDGTQFQMLTPARDPVLTAGSITAADLASDSVGTAEIVDDAVTTDKIADDAVTTAKIPDDAVTFSKIGNMSTSRVLGNMSGSTASPTSVTVYDEDDMSSDSATGLATQQSIKAYVDAQLPSAFTSAELAVTTSASHTVAHSLGSTPYKLYFTLVCKSADVGYSINDEVIIQALTDAGASRGFAVTVDSTNINIKVGSNAIQILNKSTGSTDSITPADWRLVVRAEL